MSEHLLCRDCRERLTQTIISRRTLTVGRIRMAIREAANAGELGIVAVASLLIGAATVFMVYVALAIFNEW